MPVLYLQSPTDITIAKAAQQATRAGSPKVRSKMVIINHQTRRICAINNGDCFFV